MNKKVFLDADVVLDLLYERNPYYLGALHLFTLAERNVIDIHITSLTCANIFYILRKLLSKEQAKNAIRKLLVMVKILPVDESIIVKALESEFNDFEDAIQCYAAQNANIEVLVTRNTRDYRKADISICTPEELIQILNTTDIV